MFSVNLVKLSIKLGVPVSAALLILGGVLLIVYESMLAWGVFCVCLGSGIIFFLITAKSYRYNRLQAVTSIFALGLLVASVVALLLAI
jgi:fucose permease